MIQTCKISHRQMRPLFLMDDLLKSASMNGAKYLHGQRLPWVPAQCFFSCDHGYNDLAADLSKLPEMVDWRGDTGRPNLISSFSSTWLSLKQYLGHLSGWPDMTLHSKQVPREILVRRWKCLHFSDGMSALLLIVTGMTPGSLAEEQQWEGCGTA